MFGLVGGGRGRSPQQKARGVRRLPLPADGGSGRTAIAQARAFEAAWRGFQKDVAVKYYDGGKHNGIFESRAQYLDQVQRIAAFILAHSR
jgi:hypothetical protein